MSFCPIKSTPSDFPCIINDHVDNASLNIHNMTYPDNTVPCQSPTYRNTINNWARNSDISPLIHQASKHAIYGMAASVAGVVSNTIQTINLLALSIFHTIGSWCAATDHIRRDWQEVSSRSMGFAKDTSGLLLYHVVNICTLGFLGFAIRDEQVGSKIPYASGCPYGDQDIGSYYISDRENNQSPHSINDDLEGSTILTSPDYSYPNNQLGDSLTSDSEAES